MMLAPTVARLLAVPGAPLAHPCTFQPLMSTLAALVLRSSMYSSLPPAEPRSWNPEMTTPLGEAAAARERKREANAATMVRECIGGSPCGIPHPTSRLQPCVKSERLRVGNKDLVDVRVLGVQEHAVFLRHQHRWDDERRR